MHKESATSATGQAASVRANTDPLQSAAQPGRQAASRKPQAASYWLPPLLWMCFMFGFSTDAFSANQTGSRLHGILALLFPGIAAETEAAIHFAIRKAAHVTEYALLALLWYRARRAGALPVWQGSWAVQAFAIVAGWALLDEWHQSFTATRSGSLWDSLLDMSGALLGLTALWLWQRKRSDHAET